MKNIWLEGIMGVVVGDALGMPVQFVDREELKKYPVTKMDGFGTFNMPVGTWSDDSSMTLATLDSIREKGGIDYKDIMERFVNWNYFGAYTPDGKAFDQGITCTDAIWNYWIMKDYKTCGRTGEHANGNGALMRIMPVCLYVYEKVKSGEWEEEKGVECIHQVTALTHNHERAQAGSVIYYFMIKQILDSTGSLKERFQAALNETLEYYKVAGGTHYPEMAKYGRMLEMDVFAGLDENVIKSSGYVVDSLEAVVWSLVTTNSFEEALLKAVNLGDDADTVGAIAGGLAALYYGYEAIPGKWLEVIRKREWIEEMCAFCLTK